MGSIEGNPIPKAENAQAVKENLITKAGLVPKRTILGTERQDYTGTTQYIREGKSVLYTGPDGQEFFAKYATQKTGTDNIYWLKMENYLLHLLVNSGVTPRPLELKIYPNGKGARLLTEVVPGISLDKIDEVHSKEFLIKNAEAIFLSTAESLNVIHAHDVLLTNIDGSNFLIEEKDGNFLTHIVDFKFAVDSTRLTPREILRKLHQQDYNLLALAFDEEDNHMNTESLKKSDIYGWAHTMAVKMIGMDFSSSSVTLNPDEQKQFDYLKEKFYPVLVEEITKDAKKGYPAACEWSGHFPFPYDVTSLRTFTKQLIVEVLPRKTEEALLGITLEKRLKEKGIVISEVTLDFMSRALSWDLKERPVSLRELLNSV